MNAQERKCMKGLGTSLGAWAKTHDGQASRYSEANDEESAAFHKASAAHCRSAATWCEKAAALPAGSQGGDGMSSTEETNEGGDAQAKRSTEEIDRLLQKDRSAEMGNAVAADPISDLISELAE
jgi:hypothetical protein